MNTPQVQLPMAVPQQPSLPAGTMPFPTILNIKNETCSGMFDLLKQYWWVLVLLLVVYLYYRHLKSKKDKTPEEEPEQLPTTTTD